MKRVILSALAAGIFATAAAQEELTLRKCLEIGLENNYDIRIVRNEERISDNNATAANAGMVPTIDFEAGYSGALDNERTTPREGDAWSDNGIYDQTFNAGINLNWTIFDGFRIRTNYKKLKEMQEMGTVRTRITIEDFVASLTAEYYNYVQQTLRLQNFRCASPKRGSASAISRASTCCRHAWTSMPTVRNICPSRSWFRLRASASTNCWPTRTSTKCSASATR